MNRWVQQTGRCRCIGGAVRVVVSTRRERRRPKLQNERIQTALDFAADLLENRVGHMEFKAGASAFIEAHVAARAAVFR